MTPTNGNKDTFVRITNKEIYEEVMDKLSKIHTDLTDVKIAQAITNGKTKWNTKAIYSIGGIFVTGFIFIVGWLLQIRGGSP